MQIRRKPAHIPLARVLAATGLAVAGTAAALAVSAPAQAAVATTAVAFPAGTVTASITATCPLGQFLTGGGGSVGGGGDVTLTDVIPNLATATVTVSARINSGAAPAFTLVAQADCAPGPAPANYQLVQTASPLNAVPTKIQTVVCPANTRLLGTGYEHEAAAGQALVRRITPSAALSGVQVESTAVPGFGGNWLLRAFGVCATPPGGFQLLSSAGAFSNINPRTWAAPACAAGWLTTGVGAEVSPNAAGRVVLRQITTNLAQDTTTSGAVERGVFPPAWALATHNICWQL
jgi:hypothetical protein